VEAAGKLSGPERRLLLPDGAEASVVYFRAGYTPNDYPTARQGCGRDGTGAALGAFSGSFQ